MELGVDEISLEPSSKMRRLFMKPGGREPGPDGDGRWRPDGPMPGDGARLGGVARPKPESVSSHKIERQWRTQISMHGDDTISFVSFRKQNEKNRMERK